MAKVVPPTLDSGFGSVPLLNAFFAELAEQLDNTVSRDGTSPNNMTAELDMNSNRVTNLAPAVNNNDAVTLGQLASLASGAVITKQEVQFPAFGVTTIVPETFSFVAGQNNIAVYIDGIRQVGNYTEVQTGLGLGLEFDVPFNGSQKVILVSNESVGTFDAVPAHNHTTADIVNLSLYTGFDSRYYTEQEIDGILSTRVTTNTAQTISGNKTFSGEVNLHDTVTRKDADTTATTRVPRVFVQSGDPGTKAEDGDIWIW